MSVTRCVYSIIPHRTPHSRFCMFKSRRSLVFVLAVFLATWHPEITSAFSLAGTTRCFFKKNGVHGSFPLCNSGRRTTTDLLFHMKLDDTASNLKSEETRGDTSPRRLQHNSIFSRGDLLRASLLASVISMAQPLLAAAASLVARQQYNRWWVFSLAPFANRKTVVSELVPDQVLLHQFPRRSPGVVHACFALASEDGVFAAASAAYLNSLNEWQNSGRCCCPRVPSLLLTINHIRLQWRHQ